MIIIKGNAGFCDATRIASAFVNTTDFKCRPCIYSLQVNLQGLALQHGFTLARFYDKEAAQDALDALASFLGYGMDSDVPDKIFDLNHVESKEDK